MRVKGCCGGVEMFKNKRIVILSDMFFSPSFKITTGFANITRTTASTSKFINLKTRKDFISLGIGSLYEK